MTVYFGKTGFEYLYRKKRRKRKRNTRQTEDRYQRTQGTRPAEKIDFQRSHYVWLI